MIPNDYLSLIRYDAEPVQLLPVLNVKKSEYDSIPPKSQKLYQYDPISERYNIPDEVWKTELRTGKHYGIKTTIGGSDVSAILDGSDFIKSWHFYDGQKGSNYKCALELFHQKIGLEPELADDQDDYILWNGHNAEEPIAQKFLRAYKKEHPTDDIEMYNDTHMYQCGQKDAQGNLKYPFALGDFDRIIEINGVRGILEIKSTFFSAKDYGLWEKGIVPLKYFVQVIYYMAIANLSYAYIACDKGYGEQDLTYIYIERNFELEDDLMKMVKEFVELVESGKEPDVSEQNKTLLFRYYCRLSGNFDAKKAGTVQLPEAEYADLLYELYDLQERMAENAAYMEQYKKMRDDKLSQIIGAYGKSSAAFCPLSDGRTIVLKLGIRKKTASIDQDRLKEENPELFRAYCTKFDETLFKKEQKGIAEQYMKAPTISGESTFGKFDVKIVESTQLKMKAGA